MLITGGQFGPKQGGQFALKQRGHFAPKWRGQFGRNIQTLELQTQERKEMIRTAGSLLNSYLNRPQPTQNTNFYILNNWPITAYWRIWRV